MSDQIIPRMGAGMVALGLSAVFALAGTVVYTVNATGDYYGDFTASVPILGVLTLIMAIVPAVLTGVPGRFHWTDACYPLTGVLGMVCALDYISARAESVALILGSSLEAGNAAAHQALYTAFAGIGCFLLATVAACVAGFLTARRPIGR